MKVKLYEVAYAFTTNGLENVVQEIIVKERLPIGEIAYNSRDKIL
ncbi:MAG: hypothetical protein QXN55_00750 [Candidatus Nitrosotenuis sp.]